MGSGRESSFDAYSQGVAFGKCCIVVFAEGGTLKKTCIYKQRTKVSVTLSGKYVQIKSLKLSTTNYQLFHTFAHHF
jgi:hypothetical protein